MTTPQESNLDEMKRLAGEIRPNEGDWASRLMHEAALHRFWRAAATFKATMLHKLGTMNWEAGDSVRNKEADIIIAQVKEQHP